jgi:hypothetical protein
MTRTARFASPTKMAASLVKAFILLLLSISGDVL